MAVRWRKRLASSARCPPFGSGVKAIDADAIDGNAIEVEHYWRILRAHIHKTLSARMHSFLARRQS